MRTLHETGNGSILNKNTKTLILTVENNTAISIEYMDYLLHRMTG
jgi:hypothetical protein